MSESERLSVAGVFEYESPVEFVLIATIGRQRGVVAKSVGAKIDLSAYAQKNKSKFSRKSHTPPVSSVFFPRLQNLYPLSADTELMPPLDDVLEIDSRMSECTLVWRGIDSPYFEREIESELKSCGPAIMKALDAGSRATLELILAPLIARCNMQMLMEREARIRRASLFWFFIATLGVYAVAVVGYLIFRGGVF
ncbi:hypothetical protein [Variovorax sp. 54]|uniref:hypothetical protein n=1 Tax=Variovorax sp. 54 TaxID=2035212 RepID=UPI00117EB479|nr:hypothetical protein [Variovorax sp. 54]